MARGKFNKRGGGPRLDAVSAEEIEIRNQRLADLEEERAARRAAEEEDGEEGAEGGDLEAINETKETESKPKADKKAAAEPTKAAVTTKAEHNKNIARLAEVRRRREEAEARRKAEEEAANQLEEERKKMAAMALEEAEEEAKSKKSSKKVIPKIDKIAAKKMKPALLKEALKERDLDIQGNAKQLLQRLLDYEAKR
uniref:SAP domain-containing protein n=1 Tax=Amphora coffeiformis TaxID=265554 RepID=A0A7S3LDZ8_9STRA|mmetsp:Transcript_9405/g.17960  ORF Transcript_9405/g.17960 Transcript_9405/m.17960 type:complete len:197 (+) Transcript_9405:166-756(+)